ncbi:MULTISPECIES: ABC transporter permease [unclassified Polaromonas]|jgi:peptide/nickel transport system permease protein|uniref:ABC transporter permease n=1 Tax=unclassified Polaromonas TaxID=2638319 RepID=UPI000BCD32F2|nr:MULTISPECIES: ABC transporter permease [unclassified Polaromonas]OYY39738.1 MAG: peptide ABC transporter permease [Polaromonas sp. 35-63-35]OYZ22483.1 MAG: peptide ABC transporter permease [Polaromonas sp. 16-63-31]OYZ81301.1 MAG: peptide ABC transporter permease [Polaromonas sp. 24-63-21]OZA52478.1 MAG: peptide ABC transporter permease [Polaromonas sp. 17-63-33]OZA88662.1 MAG: peptide ABC transporter permease [Polaromonas sp. 39-63-25]
MQVWQLLFQRLWRNSAFRFGVLVLGVLLALAALAPFLGTVDPAAMDSAHINTAAGVRGEFVQLDGTSVAHTFWMGADNFGRDIFSRVLYGTRTSLLVAAFTAAVAIGVGALLGMLAGYFRAVDAVLMRFMDGLMAIPAILLAIALVAALDAQLWTVVVAIAIPEIPRVTRLVRAMVLTLREEPFVEAARALATPTPVILWRHILPNAMAPLIVQGTFVAASAVLTEAILSFLGLGLPADIPTWGNIMAEGRVQFTQYPGNVLFPALFLVPTVLAINLLGDGLRDVLDPKFSKRTS